MNFGFLHNLPWFGVHSDTGFESVPKSTDVTVESSKQRVIFDIKLWGSWSLMSLFPWAINTRNKMQIPPTLNRELQKQTQGRGVIGPSSRSSVPPFRPYVAKVPWHKGSRAFLSQLFPRYGHYCGPNWSSGKDNGLPLWDKRPIDWLDFCCYCHDIGYDTHDQAKLLKADLAFLECLERPYMSIKGDAHIAHLYKTMCIAGTSINRWSRSFTCNSSMILPL
uniref:Phospholipase A2 family protein n=1 Tax=Nelumbo nucifera TaxID=4432 RepID=A0A822ZCB5_NELNU|nr:TPA_asm: hypothetical protein HUJ06_001012 [Nelumbo nucifera]